jgi:hypothetical protein
VQVWRLRPLSHLPRQKAARLHARRPTSRPRGNNSTQTAQGSRGRAASACKMSHKPLNMLLQVDLAYAKGLGADAGAVPIACSLRLRGSACKCFKKIFATWCLTLEASTSCKLFSFPCLCMPVAHICGERLIHLDLEKGSRPSYLYIHRNFMIQIDFSSWSAAAYKTLLTDPFFVVFCLTGCLKRCGMNPNKK